MTEHLLYEKYKEFKIVYNITKYVKISIIR